MIMMIKMVATIRRVFKGFQQLPFNARSSVSISPSPPLLFCQPLELHALLSRKKAAAEIRKKREGEWRGGEFAIHRSRKPRDEDIIVIRGRVFKRGKNAKEGGREGEGAWVGERGRRWDAPVHRLANKEHDPAPRKRNSERRRSLKNISQPCVERWLSLEIFGEKQPPIWINLESACTLVIGN